MSDKLDPKYTDKVVAATKSVSSMVPMVGGLLGELLTSSAPNQRTERIVSYIRKLERRLATLEESVTSNILSSPEKIDLIEEGGFQAARATSEERIERVVEIVANGLEAEESEIIRRKRLLKLLGQIDDDEFAILRAYGRSYAGGDHNAFSEINIPEPPTLDSHSGVIQQNKLYELGKMRLTQLGLLQKNYGSLKKDQLPEFDPRSGDFKHRLEVSYLGRLLLREAGIELPFKD